MGKTQHVLGQEGEKYIIGVDWAEDDSSTRGNIQNAALNHDC